jgi:hypothetical protein
MTIQYQPDLFDDEWDKLAHTPDEYRREIRQLRERCYKYAKELEGLRALDLAIFEQTVLIRTDLDALSSEMERMERQA